LASPFFVPPRPPVRDPDSRWYHSLTAVRTNALRLWSQEAYEEDVLAGRFLGRPNLVVNAPDLIHHVLIANAGNYRRTPATIRILRPIVGRGLLLSEGDEWKHQRRTIAPALAPRVIPLLARHIAGAAHDTARQLAIGDREAVDLLSAVQMAALEIAARSMFSLEVREYGAAMRALMQSFAARLGRPYLFDILLPPAIPTLRDIARRRFRKSWLELMDNIIAARLAAPPSETPRDLFDLLRAARDPETGAAFSHTQLRDQVATMIVAGHETTALTLFWSLYLLACAPEEQRRVSDEVRDLDLSAEGAAHALPKLAATRAVVDETLRLYPPAFLLIRQAIGADRCREIVIPRSSLVMISPWVLHRHVRLWDNPDAFNPSRFRDGAPKHRFAFLPFGAGPRICVGAQFALAEASLVLAILIQKFEFALADTLPVLPVAVVTTQPDRPAPFRLRRRSEPDPATLAFDEGAAAKLAAN